MSQLHPGQLHEAVLSWYDERQRNLPWRSPSATPWAVMVSEFMLQQTPVSRVLPVYDAWLREWPRPSDLAEAPTGDAVRMWGRLGYPRRALRLHAAATAIVALHGGEVPSALDDLRALPGVGEYTAAAIATFAFKQRHAVLDTNVRRVLTRLVTGSEFPAASLSKAERALATELLPSPELAPAWSVAVMELGALVCTASSPECGSCPVVEDCAWHAAGRPAHDGPPRKAQTYAGTDRQCRGRLLAVVRDAHEPVHKSRLDAVWSDDTQRERCLRTLLEDRLITQPSPGIFALP